LDYGTGRAVQERFLEKKKEIVLEIGCRDWRNRPARWVTGQHPTAKPYRPGSSRRRVQGRNSRL